MNRYQWTVLFAAWLGWGFDAFDAFLFNYVSSSCVPDLLNIDPTSPEAAKVTYRWTGYLTSVLLVGWAIGGIGFGKLADRIGRSRTLILTILVYSLGTAACAFAPNIYILGVFRFITSLGIGGEWAAGAAMVAEVVPEKKRLMAGALLYSAAPVGLFAAGWLSDAVVHHWMPDNPNSWRYVFLFGLVPAAFAIVVRHLVKEPEAWKPEGVQPTIAELFSPAMRARTFSGTSMAVTALLAWWCTNAFLPQVIPVFAREGGLAQGLEGEALKTYVAEIRRVAINVFNAGGLVGTFMGLPLAHSLGRRATFGAYFLLSGLSIIGTFGLALPMNVRLGLLFVVGVTGFGALGSFTYYLPELFPTHLRATASGFCYNVGRFVTALGPFVVGYYASLKEQGSDAIMLVMPICGLIPIAALVLLPWVVETRDWKLGDAEDPAVTATFGDPDEAGKHG